MKATLTLFLLCIVTTIYSWVHPPFEEYLSFSSFNLSNGAYWTLVSTLFVHGSLMHLGGNMLALLVFGIPLEKIIGQGKLYLAFFLGGIGGLLIGRFYYPPHEFLIGASGSICTLIATLLLFDPWRISFILTLLPMPLGAAGLFYLLLNVYLSGRSYYNPYDNPVKIAYELHVIGFAIGIVLGSFWSPKWGRNLFISIGLFIMTCVFYYVLFRMI